MARQYHILIALGFLIAAGWLAHLYNKPVELADFSCAAERVATFGWTNATRSRAELAAILRWKDETKKLGLGKTYGEWHHAQKRFVQCRAMGGPYGHFQCKVSGTPCRPAEKGAGA